MEKKKLIVNMTWKRAARRVYIVNISISSQTAPTSSIIFYRFYIEWFRLKGTDIANQNYIF